MEETYRFTRWFVQSWSRVALPLSLGLLLFSPFILRGTGFLPFLVFLHVPVYMIHQYEEHAHGRFRDFVNQTLGGGKLILTDQAIFWINILLVWALDLCVLYATFYWATTLGLIAAYLTFVNGLSHISIALVQRRYNPGLWTSIVLFIPLGGITLVALSTATHATLSDHILGLGCALLGHAFIVMYIRRKIDSVKVKEALQ